MSTVPQHFFLRLSCRTPDLYVFPLFYLPSSNELGRSIAFATIEPGPCKHPRTLLRNDMIVFN